MHAARHRQLVCAAVGSNAQLCWLWACSACGVLDVAAACSSYASQCAQLEASSALCSARGTVSFALSSRHRQCVRAAVDSNAHSYVGFVGLQCMRCAGRGRHSQCAQLEAPSPLYSARGTVSLYVQLSALMHSYVGFGLAVHAVCWTRPPLTFICLGVCSAGGTVSFVLSSRHHQPVCAAVGPNAQLCRLWACSACGVLDVAAAYTLYASQCAQLEAPSAVRAAVGSNAQLRRL